MAGGLAVAISRNATGAEILDDLNVASTDVVVLALLGGVQLFGQLGEANGYWARPVFA